MIMVRLLISVGSWLVWRVAEKATRPVPERTDIPSALPAGSEDGVESQTTRHFPSSTMGSVSFCPLTTRGTVIRSTASIGSPELGSIVLLLSLAISQMKLGANALRSSMPSSGNKWPILKNWDVMTYCKSYRSLNPWLSFTLTLSLYFAVALLSVTVSWRRSTSVLSC